MPESNFSDFGRKPWTIVRRFDQFLCGLITPCCCNCLVEKERLLYTPLTEDWLTLFDTVCDCQSFESPPGSNLNNGLASMSITSVHSTGHDCGAGTLFSVVLYVSATCLFTSKLLASSV